MPHGRRRVEDGDVLAMLKEFDVDYARISPGPPGPL